jgi:hypothetical protein
LYLRAVQSSTGALFLTAGPNAWPVVPDQIGDADLAALSRESEIDGAFPAGPLLVPPRPQMIVQGSDGTLYLVHGVAAWPLVPDQITDSDLAALNLGSEIDGTIPSGLGSGVAAPLPGSRSGSTPVTQDNSAVTQPQGGNSQSQVITCSAGHLLGQGVVSYVCDDGFVYQVNPDVIAPRVSKVRSSNDIEAVATWPLPSMEAALRKPQWVDDEGRTCALEDGAQSARITCTPGDDAASQLYEMVGSGAGAAAARSGAGLAELLELGSAADPSDDS